MRISVADYVADFVRLGREPAVRERRGYRTVSWTYGDIAFMARAFARQLKHRGLLKGASVMLWGPNRAAWVAAFLGCADRGVVAIPMDEAASPEFARRVFHQVNGKLLVCARVQAQIGLPTMFFEDLEQASYSEGESDLEPVKIVAEDPLQIVFTSGTTAEPKGVVITHGNVLANVGPLEEQIRPYLKYERFVHPLRFLCLLPLSHVFGQFLGIYLPPLLGATVLFLDSFNPGEVFHTVERERVSVLVAVPRMLASLREKIERDLETSGRAERFLDRYRRAQGRNFLRRWWMFRDIHRQLGWKFWAFISGGASLDTQIEEFWTRLGYAVIQGYGLTETTSLISVNHPFKVGKGSIGKVLAGREVKLAADGEILVRGGGVASGYLSPTGFVPVASEEGWYHTGDVGELDEEGNLFFRGRKKEVIVTAAGMNVYPEDLETAVKKQAGVQDCVVVALAVDGNAEPCAVLLLKANAPSPDRIIQEANRQLAEYQRIHRWLEWSDRDFPRTPTHKPRRRDIADVAEKTLGAASSPPAPPNGPLSELIARILKRPAVQLSKDARLDSDLNLGSLERVELMSALEDRYQIQLSETRFSAANTVGDLERMLEGGPLPRAVYHYPAWVQRWPITWIRFAVHYLLLRPSVFLLGWPRIEGRENLAGVNGPVLVVSNHIGDVDVGFVLTALPARIRHKLATATGGEALEALRTPPPNRRGLLSVFDRIEWVLGVSLLNLFPLPREAGFRDSFVFAGESVDRGYSVLVFPEGHHTTDGKLRPFHAGVGLLVNNLGIPVVPMRIDGLFEVKHSGKRIARPYQIRIRIGKPIRFAGVGDPVEIASQLEKSVADL